MMDVMASQLLRPSQCVMCFNPIEMTLPLAMQTQKHDAL